MWMRIEAEFYADTFVSKDLLVQYAVVSPLDATSLGTL